MKNLLKNTSLAITGLVVGVMAGRREDKQEYEGPPSDSYRFIQIPSKDSKKETLNEMFGLLRKWGVDYVNHEFQKDGSLIFIYKII